MFPGINRVIVNELSECTYSSYYISEGLVSLLCATKTTHLFCLSPSLFDVVPEHLEFVVESGLSGHGSVSGSLHSLHNGANLLHILLSRVNFTKEKERLLFHHVSSDRYISLLDSIAIVDWVWE